MHSCDVKNNIIFCNITTSCWKSSATTPQLLALIIIKVLVLIKGLVLGLVINRAGHGMGSIMSLVVSSVMGFVTGCICWGHDVSRIAQSSEILKWQPVSE